MDFALGEDELELFGRQGSIQYNCVSNRDEGFEFSVLGVEIFWEVVFPVHVDFDFEELADHWHRLIIQGLEMFFEGALRGMVRNRPPVYARFGYSIFYALK
jgi:hypothetical protein